MDPRHEKRLQTVQNLYASSFVASKKNIPFPQDPKIIDIYKNLEEIDGLIKKFAPKFPIDKIAKMDLAILRVSVYDMVIDKKIPEKVIINEAIELAKEFSGEKSYAFINAVLGAIFKHLSEKNEQPR